MFNLSDLSDGVAIVGAFMGGCAVMTIGIAGWYAILGKIDQCRKGNHGEMAVRNR